MKKKLFGLLAGTALVLAACGGGDDASDKKDGGATQTASAAEDIYKKSCAGCHGQNLEGGAGPALDKVGSKYSQDEIKNIIANGRGGMPGGLIQGEDVDKVAEWLASKK
ncbi:cytochrome c551 [Thermolongibacillus altinsuensis]|jgi:cytochrome c551|uniref:cytochrome c551 n=1 Tax=Thermolongibacillus altinsuensis TaxID=575256 RepID=UPI00242A3264|nr:cytochrome c [Thermolongibacillus altinsuensis]GMB09110.1 cytochrome c' [Thermolongibacillus altinsuensis]